MRYLILAASALAAAATLAPALSVAGLSAPVLTALGTALLAEPFLRGSDDALALPGRSGYGADVDGAVGRSTLGARRAGALGVLGRRTLHALRRPGRSDLRVGAAGLLAAHDRRPTNAVAAATSSPSAASPACFHIRGRSAVVTTGSGGKPYTSGSSSSRKNAPAPPTPPSGSSA